SMSDGNQDDNCRVDSIRSDSSAAAAMHNITALCSNFDRISVQDPVEANEDVVLLKGKPPGSEEQKLHIATKEKLKEMLVKRQPIDYTVDIKSLDTPLHRFLEAPENQLKSSSELLRQLKSILTELDKLGFTPLSLCLKSERLIELISPLVLHGAQMHHLCGDLNERCNHLHYAMLKSSPRVINAILDEVLNQDPFGADGMYALNKLYQTPKASLQGRIKQAADLPHVQDELRRILDRIPCYPPVEGERRSGTRLHCISEAASLSVTSSLESPNANIKSRTDDTRASEVTHWLCMIRPSLVPRASRRPSWQHGVGRPAESPVITLPTRSKATAVTSSFWLGAADPGANTPLFLSRSARLRPALSWKMRQKLGRSAPTVTIIESSSGLRLQHLPTGCPVKDSQRLSMSGRLRRVHSEQMRLGQDNPSLQTLGVPDADLDWSSGSGCRLARGDVGIHRVGCGAADFWVPRILTVAAGGFCIDSRPDSCGSCWKLPVSSSSLLTASLSSAASYLPASLRPSFTAVSNAAATYGFVTPDSSRLQRSAAQLCWQEFLAAGDETVVVFVLAEQLRQLYYLQKDVLYFRIYSFIRKSIRNFPTNLSVWRVGCVKASSRRVGHHQQAAEVLQHSIQPVSCGSLAWVDQQTLPALPVRVADEDHAARLARSSLASRIAAAPRAGSSVPLQVSALLVAFAGDPGAFPTEQQTKIVAGALAGFGARRLHSPSRPGTAVLHGADQLGAAGHHVSKDVSHSRRRAYFFVQPSGQRCHGNKSPIVNGDAEAAKVRIAIPVECHQLAGGAQVSQLMPRRRWLHRLQLQFLRAPLLPLPLRRILHSLSLLRPPELA
uniref:FH2 domain-containing protein n=1 Tax=Macrostomum lignano TaxID=282301 RepID=A0A1I8FV75_9PLAT